MSVGPDAFGEDYLYFYETMFTDEGSDAGADIVWRLLDLEPGSDVLDLACGQGRIASRLAARGARVTGLDADGYLLGVAQAAGGDVEYVLGDMRALPWSVARFDAVVLWFTAFGYFDDATNAKVLREIRRVVRDGGRLLIDTQHLPWVLEHMRLQSFLRRGSDVMLDDYSWDPQSSLMRTRRTYIRDGVVRELSYDLRMYMPVELRTLLLDAGFSRVDLLNRDGEPVQADDFRLIAVAHA